MAQYSQGASHIAVLVVGDRKCVDMTISELHVTAKQGLNAADSL